MKNVYMFNASCHGSVYGVGTYIKQTAKALKDSGINITIVLLESGQDILRVTEEDGLKTIHLPRPVCAKDLANPKQKKRYSRNIVYLLKTYITESKEIIFHINYLNNSYLAEFLKTTFSCKIILSIHYMPWCFQFHDNIDLLKQTLLKEYDSLNFSEKNIVSKIDDDIQVMQKYYDKIITIAHHSQETLQSIYKVPSCKITQIYNGLEDRYKSLSKEERILMRKKYHIKENEKIILYAGRLSLEKGILFLIQAFSQLCEHNNNLRLIIAGDGHFSDCLQEIKNNWCKITFTGLINKATLYELYSIADIGVVPSLYEEFGFVAAEMMMHQLPIVANYTTGLKELMEEGKSTFFIRLNEVEKRESVDYLAEKIQTLLSNPALRKKISKNARIRFLQNFEANTFKSNITSFYKEL